MMMRLFVLLVFVVQLSVQSLCSAQMKLDTVFPYSLTGAINSDVIKGSTNPLYLNLENINSDKKNNIIVKIHIPRILKYEANKSSWKIVDDSDNLNELVIENSWSLRENYDKKFDLLFLKTDENAKIGKYKIKIETIYKNKKIIKHIDFNVLNNILNEMVDLFSSNLYNHENANFYKNLALVLKVFIEFERHYYNLSKPKSKEIKEVIRPNTKVKKKDSVKRAKRNLDEINSL